MSNKTLFSISLTLMLILGIRVCAQNPIIGDIGVSDPHIRVFNNKIYLYSGHDATPDDKDWIMRDWRVFETSDLKNWKHVQTISPKDNFMGSQSHDCWASDAATRNGKYYFYFSDRKRGVGVMVSDSADGHYIDPLGKALISPQHDPTLYVDDDAAQTPYLLYGDKELSYHIVKLNNDMVSVAEQPRPIVVKGQVWDDEPDWLDKSYLFKHKDTYYLSWGAEYATSKNIYGPYECTDKVGEGYDLDHFAHGSFFYWKGQFYHIWCRYQRKGYKYRECIISYCHIDDNGLIATDTEFLDQHFATGVAQYNASWERIEAEWFYEISEGITKRGIKGEQFYIADIKGNDFVRFASVTFDEPCTKLNMSLANKGKATIEVRLGSATGQLVGTMQLDTTRGFENVSCDIQAVEGLADVYFVYKGGKGATMKLDYFSFE